MSFFRAGHAERVKGLYHLGVGAAALGAAGYNAAAFFTRDKREPHLAVNTVLYLALAWWEYGQWRHHQERVTCASSPPCSSASRSR